MPSGTLGGPGRLSTIAAVGLLSAVFACNVFRAARQSMTYDEAFTYQHYVAAPWYHLVTHFDANNHLVNSLGCRLTTWLFGVSEFTMRIPSLAGGLAYLAAVFFLCRYAFGDGLLLLMGVAALGLNPFVLDYLSVARGYGLALGFLFWGLYHLFRFIEGPGSGPGRKPCRWRLACGSVCLALAVFSNLTFLLMAASVAATFLGMSLWSGRSEPATEGRARWRRDLCVDFLWPGLLVFGVLGVSLVKMRLRAFYVGKDSLAASLRGLVAASLAHHRTAWPWDATAPAFARVIAILAPWGVGLVILAMAIAAVRTVFRWTGRDADQELPARNARFLVLVAGSFLLCCLLNLALHFALGVKYPYERTGISLVPMFSLAGLAAISRAPRRYGLPRCVAVPGVVLGMLLILQFAVQFPATYYREWRFDCTSRQIFQLISRDRDLSARATVRVTCHWLYEPSLEFYRSVQHASWLELLDSRHGEVPGDFYVYQYNLSPADPGWTTVFASPESETAVAVPAISHTTAATSPGS